MKVEGSFVSPDQISRIVQTRMHPEARFDCGDLLFHHFTIEWGPEALVDGFPPHGHVRGPIQRRRVSWDSHLATITVGNRCQRGSIRLIG